MIDALWRIGLRVAYRTLRVRWWITRPDAHGAFVAVWQDTRLLLIRNSYRSAETVPCGAIEDGESPREAARRELFEEVGIETPEEALAPAGEFVVDFDHKHDHAHFFELLAPPNVEIRIDRREVVWGEFVDASELRERPLVPHVRAYLEERLEARSQSAS